MASIVGMNTPSSSTTTLTSYTSINDRWLSPWANRQLITVYNYNYLPMTEFQARLEIDHKAGMQSDFSDLRFTNDENTSQLPYWIEYHESNTSAVVWLQLDSIAPFSSADFYLYYANDAATSGSNPEATFVFYDDFDEDVGFNDIGSPSTAIVMFDSLTSTLQKYDNCGSDGTWKSIGDTLSSFKLITREYMPADSDDECTTLEYGVETANFQGINLTRDAMDLGFDTPFGLEIRDGDNTSNIITSPADQPPGAWYRTSLSYAYVCHFNLHAMMFSDSMEVLGNVYGETYTPYQFDRFTMRGGHTYYMDYVAVAKHMCVWPVVNFSEEIETCPQGTLVEFQSDLCEEGLGEITINVAGGIAPYVINWYMDQDSLGSITMDTTGHLTIDSLSAGSYSFKIIDSEGCEN